MGRKKGKTNKTKRVNIRCTKLKKEAIRQLASDHEMDVSAFVRKKALYREASLFSAVEFLSMYREKIDELKEIGDKINQLTRYANYVEKSGLVPPGVFEEMSELLQEFIRNQRETADLNRKILKA